MREALMGVPGEAVGSLALPREAGTYVLEMLVVQPRPIEIGRLGRVTVPAGWYFYIGSALGGLHARLARHLRTPKPQHWHIDALREIAEPTSVYLRLGPERLECQAVDQIINLPGASLPVRRFGASDCRCRAHLVRFAERPVLQLGTAWQHVSLTAVNTSVNEP